MVGIRHFGHRISWIRGCVRAGERVLEVGCADNPVWGSTGVDTTLLDLPNDTKANLANKAKPHVYATAERIPFSDSSFNVVSVCELLEHVNHPDWVLREAVRVSSRAVVLTVPNEWEWPKELLPFAHGGHVRFYNDETFLALLEGARVPYEAVRIHWNGWAWFGARVFKAGDFKNSPVSRSAVGVFSGGSFLPTVKVVL